MIILTMAAGPMRVGRAVSIIGVPMLLGPTFGSVLGGLLIALFIWHARRADEPLIDVRLFGHCGSPPRP